MPAGRRSRRRNRESAMTKILLRGAHSGDRLGLVEIDVEAGFGGPPLHTHELRDEGFYVLQGEVTIQAAERVVTTEPGASVFASRETPHTFANHSGKGARMLIAFTPAGFERALAGEMTREDIPALILRRAEPRIGG